MLLTSSEGGLLCYLAPARDETLEGAEEQQEGDDSSLLSSMLIAC